MRGIYKIAGRVIEIESVYDEVHKLCHEYKHSGSVDFSVKVSQNDIDSEREKSARSAGGFSDSYLETLAVYRRIAEQMIEFDTILFHGSLIAVDGEGYLFTAKSGTGKSTHTRLWRELFGERAVMVNDDKPLLHITENGILAYGTPWDGKHHLSSNIAVPLKAVCILARAESNHIEKIMRSSAYPMLLQQTCRPENSFKMRKTLKLLNKILNAASLYKLECNMNIEAAETAYNAMKG